jgi:hypothetical protein
MPNIKFLYVVTLFSCIQEVSGSNPTWDTYYSDWDFWWFSLDPPAKCFDRMLDYNHLHPVPN